VTEILEGRKEAPVAEEALVSKEAFISREFAALETERLWARVWQVASREEEVANVGDFVEYKIVDQSIVVVRADETTIRAYFNACLHRGTPLKYGCGISKAKLIVIPLLSVEPPLAPRLALSQSTSDGPVAKGRTIRSAVAATTPVRALGCFFAVALDTTLLIPRRPFAWREPSLQSWFPARVLLLATLMLAIPLTVLLILTFNILLVEFGAADYSGTGAAYGSVTQIGQVMTVLVAAGAGATAMCADLGAAVWAAEKPRSAGLGW
jgi:hypothetical protein